MSEKEADILLRKCKLRTLDYKSTNIIAQVHLEDISFRTPWSVNAFKYLWAIPNENLSLYMDNVKSRLNLNSTFTNAAKY